jgi:hypothetical protein
MRSLCLMLFALLRAYVVVIVTAVVQKDGGPSKFNFSILADDLAALHKCCCCVKGVQSQRDRSACFMIVLFLPLVALCGCLAAQLLRMAVL